MTVAVLLTVSLLCMSLDLPMGHMRDGQRGVIPSHHRSRGSYIGYAATSRAIMPNDSHLQLLQSSCQLLIEGSAVVCGKLRFLLRHALHLKVPKVCRVTTAPVLDAHVVQLAFGCLLRVHWRRLLAAPRGCLNINHLQCLLHHLRQSMQAANSRPLLTV